MLERKLIYGVWVGMKLRCNNPNHISYPRYGGRGIKICKNWPDFDSFVADMLPGYKKGLQLDRANNDADYCKENCRWVTRKEQSNNRRSSRFIEYRGKKRTIAQWATVVGMSTGRLWDRINTGKWTIDECMNPKKLKPWERRQIPFIG